MPSEATRSVSPPKARLTFRVGIVGHRPNRLKREDIPSLTARLAEVLSSVKKAVEAFSAAHSDLFAVGPPCVRAVSPLAEGTDRYFARQALRLGYELCCPLPFHKEEFENDFQREHSVEAGMDSVADFNSILKEAREKSGLVMFELDGIRAEASEAYAAAGRVVLNQSDLLTVVWDGGDNNKRGGTYETLKEAVAFHVPVLWVDARAPHQWQLLEQESDLPVCSGQRCVPKRNEAPNLTTVVDRILRAPQPPAEGEHDKNTPDLRIEYFAEGKPARNWGFVWKLFRDLVGSFRFRIQKLGVQDFEEMVAGDWPKDAPGVAGWVNARLISHYAWSDKLADFYADKYRSSFVLCYLLGALAVMLAVLPFLYGVILKALPGTHLPQKESIETICSVLEFFVVAVILFLVWRGNKRRWHDRWMAYRLVAELVRQLRFLIPLGGGRPFARSQPHLNNYGNPANSWTYWHLRAIDRAVGLPNAKLTADHLRDCLGYVEKVVQSQIAFHHHASERSERIEHRLHKLGVRLFVVTVILIAIHVLLHFFFPKKWHGTAEAFGFGLTFFCASLPAVGAALAAIKNQGEFARITRRSRAMEEQLNQMNRDLEQLRTKAVLRSSEVASYALRVAQLMVDEVLDWRVVFLDRPLVTPA